MSFIDTGDHRLRATVWTNFLLAELLGSRAGGIAPLFLVSPWITDFPLQVRSPGDLAGWIDSNDSLPYLFDCIRRIATVGRTVCIVVRTETAPERVQQFLAPLRRRLANEPNIALRHQPDLHAKIYVGEYGALYGSPNLTRSGMERNVELARYVSDARTLAQLRAEAQAIFELSTELAK